MGRLQVEVLGSLRVRLDDAPLPLEGDRRRALLAALVARRGMACPAPWLAEVVWRGAPPPGAAATLQSHVSILRRLLGPGVIHTMPEGYALVTTEVEVDADRFEDALLGARRASEPLVALEHLELALTLYRGEPFAELADLEPLRGEVARLEHLAADAVTQRLECLVRLGRPAEAVAHGEQAIADHPLREQPWAIVAGALYGLGRQADALRLLHRLRTVLAETLGILPSPEVQELEHRMLRQDPTLAPAPGASSPRPPERPPTRYAALDGVHIAYQVVGDAGPWIVASPPLAQNVEICWEDPHHRRLIERVAASCRFVHFDERGTGMSDRAAGLTMAERVGDFTAVMDDAGIDRAVLCGVSEGGPVAIAFAAAHPERVAGLFLVNTYERVTATDDHPIGVAAEQQAARAASWEATWGRDDSDLVDWFAPSLRDDAGYRRWLAHYMRQSCSPGTLAAINRANATIDVRPLLRTLRMPTVVVHRVDDRVVPVAWGRYLAEHIPGATYVELEGADHLPWVGDTWAEIVDLGVALAHRP